MDKLLNPDVGLMVWTVITFVGVVLVLGRFAWKPIVAALEAREEKIRADLKAAEESRLSAEKIRADYDQQLALVEARAKELIAQAQLDSQRLRDQMLKSAQEESARLAEKTRRELGEEQRRLVKELRAEVAAISMKAAEKLIRQSIDKTLQEKFVHEAMEDFEEWSKEVH